MPSTVGPPPPVWEDLSGHASRGPALSGPASAGPAAAAIRLVPSMARPGGSRRGAPRRQDGEEVPDDGDRRRRVDDHRDAEAGSCGETSCEGTSYTRMPCVPPATCVPA